LAEVRGCSRTALGATRRHDHSIDALVGMVAPVTDDDVLRTREEVIALIEQHRLDEHRDAILAAVRPGLRTVRVGLEPVRLPTHPSKMPT
jgi:hypothetical protein